MLFAGADLLIAYYKGMGSGIFAGFVFAVFVYLNVLRSKVRDKQDELHGEETKIRCKIFSPYKKRFLYALLVVVLLNMIFYAFARWWEMLILFDMIFLVVFLGFLSKIRLDAGKKEMLAAAQEMGFVYLPIGDVASIHGRLQTLGQDLRLVNVFLGTIDGRPARIFDFYYKWMKKAAYEATILETADIGTCPCMLIISKADAFGETFVPSKLFPGVYVRLEGDFDKYFTLFVEHDAEDEIRQILTPDIMAVLIDKMSDLSFMFFDNSAYVVLTNNSEHGFLKENFVEQVNRARFVIAKWAPALSRMKSRG